MMAGGNGLSVLLNQIASDLLQTWQSAKALWWVYVTCFLSIYFPSPFSVTAALSAVVCVAVAHSFKPGPLIS
jgi:hypothetical protein